MLLNRLKWLSVFILGVLLISCSSGSKEIETYMNEDLQDAMEVLDQTNKDSITYSEHLMELKSAEAMAFLQEEIIPKWEKVRDDMKSIELETEDLAAFNDDFIALVDSIITRQEVMIDLFKDVLEQESSEEIHSLDLEGLSESVYEHNETYYDHVVTFNDGIVTLAETYDLEWEDDEKPRVEEEDIASLNDLTDEILFKFIQGALLAIESGEVSDDEPTEEQTNESDITFIGEVEIDDTFRVHGETNIVPGAELTVNVFQFGTENPYFKEEIVVADDGSFELEVAIDEEELIGVPIEVRVRYNPEKGSVEEQELYGEEGENLTGSFVHKYTNIKRTRKGIFAHAFIELEKGAKESFIEHNWSKPDDYGDLAIWMEAEKIEKHDDYYDIYMKSNIMELSLIRATVEDPGYELAGYTSRTYVLPDGSFRFQIQRPDIDSDDTYVVIEVDGSFAIETEEIYGENGENFEGDFVADTKKGLKIEYKLPVEDTD